MLRTTNPCAAVMLALALTGGAAAECPPLGRTVLIEPGHASVAIPKAGLVDVGSGQALLGSGPALHGTLTSAADDLVYTPGDDFWTVGNDSFTVTLGLPAPSSSVPQVKLVRLVALIEPAPEDTILQDFEGSLTVPWEASCLGSTCAINSAGALTATQGLRITPFNGLPSVAQRQNGGHGGSDTAGAGNNYRPPPIGGGTATCEVGCPPADELVFRVLALGSDPEPNYALETRRSGDHYEMQILENKTGISRRSSWVPIPDKAQNVRLLTWNDNTLTGRVGGAFLMVNRELKRSLSAVAGSPPLLSLPLRIGLLDPVTASGSFDFDDVALFTTTTTGQECQVTDDFEPGTTDSAWTATYGGGALVVDPEAKGSGSGLGLIVNMVESAGTFGGQLGLTVDPNRHRFGARFFVDPALLQMPTGGAAVLAEWRTTGGSRAFRVSLVQNGNDLRFRIYARQDDGTVINPPAFTLSRGPHVVEVDWLRSPTDAVDAATGYARVWVDGVRRFDLANLANDGQLVTEMRVGASSASASGRVFLDQVEVWDSP